MSVLASELIANGHVTYSLACGYSSFLIQLKYHEIY